MYRTAPWGDEVAEPIKPAIMPNQDYQSISNLLHDTASQITGAFDRLSVIHNIKPKTRGIADQDLNVVKEFAVQPPEPAKFDLERAFSVDKRTYNVFRTLLSAPSDGIGKVSKSVKWAEFRRAMVCIGFSVERLQGSAWQFTPQTNVGIGRNIHFHEPHPDNEITYVITKRMGRRLSRVYDWHRDMLTLA